MKLILIILLPLFAFNFAKAQTKVFKSYEEYKSNTGEEMDSEFIYTNEVDLTRMVRVTFKTLDGNKVRYHPREIWGFKFMNHLFRSTDNNQFAMLIDTGKIYYYENGIGSIWALKKNGEGHYMAWETFCFISVGLAEEVYTIKRSNFTKNHPELDDFFTCLKDKDSHSPILDCVKSYNKTKHR
jgi:hypothetical protein